MCAESAQAALGQQEAERAQQAGRAQELKIALRASLLQTTTDVLSVLYEETTSRTACAMEEFRT